MMNMMYRSMWTPLCKTLVLIITVTSTISCQKDHNIPRVDEQPSISTETIEESIEHVASELSLQAYTEEEKVTRLLQDLAKENSAQLKGLEHRLKTKSSTLRKLKKLHREQPKKAIKSLRVSDALRYTIETSDSPKGHYVQVVQSVLKGLEDKGYKVLKVKNYWPRGDNYSGVNTVLSTSNAFEWELQFHTLASYQEIKRSHGKYEKLRSSKATVSEKQKLFSEMTKPWEQIEIPSGVLTPKNLHINEQIKKWDAPH